MLLNNYMYMYPVNDYLPFGFLLSLTVNENGNSLLLFIVTVLLGHLQYC